MTHEPEDHGLEQSSGTGSAGASPPQGQDADGESNEQVMELLSGHVPLSLIMDLSSPVGPDSQQILETEGAPQDDWWLQTGADQPSGSDHA